MQDPRQQNHEDPRLSSLNKPTPMPYLPLPVRPPAVCKWTILWEFIRSAHSLFFILAGTLAAVSRPSFKPLEELIFCGQLKELLQHPEFR